MKQLTIINKILKGLIFLSIFFLLAGITYSYFLADIKDAETGTTLTGEAGRLDITYDGGGSIITATGFGPKEATFATKTFTLKGNSNIEDSILGYKIILVVDENTFTENALSYTMISTKTTSNGEIAPSIETNRYLNTSDVELGTGYFTGTVTDAIHTYELKLYFLDTGVDQSIDMEKSIKIHITIENYLHPKLSEAILAQGGGAAFIEGKGTPYFSDISPLTEEYEYSGYYEYEEYYDGGESKDWFTGNQLAFGTGYTFNEETGKFSLTNYTLNNSVSTDFINYYACWDDNQIENCDELSQIKSVSGSKVASVIDIYSEELAILKDSGDTGIYAAFDEYGTSYYYRGSKEHLKNNIIFGGFQWKIIRINGDGSIRLVYNGTEEQFNKKGIMNRKGFYTQIEGLHFWNETYNNDAKYLGYMYGGSNGVASTQRDGTTSSSATYNETSSNAKIQLDTWYQNNILDKPFEDKIVDNLYCNDRQLYHEATEYEIISPGYGSEVSGYASYFRLDDNETPSLKCTQKNDRFTVNDSEIGNSALTYPVGLLSADEMAFAGLMAWERNLANYLITNYRYWTMTPADLWTDVIAYMWQIEDDGEISDDGVLNSVFGLRPVLNISSAIKVSGDGSMTNPFRAL